MTSANRRIPLREDEFVRLMKETQKPDAIGGRLVVNAGFGVGGSWVFEGGWEEAKLKEWRGEE